MKAIAHATGSFLGQAIFWAIATAAVYGAVVLEHGNF